MGATGGCVHDRAGDRGGAGHRKSERRPCFQSCTARTSRPNRCQELFELVSAAATLCRMSSVGRGPSRSSEQEGQPRHQPQPSPTRAAVAPQAFHFKRRASVLRRAGRPAPRRPHGHLPPVSAPPQPAIRRQQSPPARRLQPAVGYLAFQPALGIHSRCP